MPSSPRFTVAAALALLALTACRESTPPTPGNGLAAMAELVDETLRAATGALAEAGVSMPAVPFGDACTFDAATQFFVCDDVSRDGMTSRRSFQVLDASNRPLSTADRSSIAAIRTVSVLTSIRSVGGGEPDTMVVHSDLTLSGLLTGHRVMNGTTTMRSSGRGRVSEAVQTWRDLVSGPGYLSAGTITIERSTAHGDLTLTSRTTMTFNGPLVTMTTELGSTTRTCTFDQTDRSTLPACT